MTFTPSPLYATGLSSNHITCYRGGDMVPHVPKIYGFETAFNVKKETMFTLDYETAKVHPCLLITGYFIPSPTLAERGSVLVHICSYTRKSKVSEIKVSESYYPVRKEHEYLGIPQILSYLPDVMRIRHVAKQLRLQNLCNCHHY